MKKMTKEVKKLIVRAVNYSCEMGICVKQAPKGYGAMVRRIIRHRKIVNRQSPYSQGIKICGCEFSHSLSTKHRLEARDSYIYKGRYTSNHEAKTYFGAKDMLFLLRNKESLPRSFFTRSKYGSYKIICPEGYEPAIKDGVVAAYKKINSRIYEVWANCELSYYAKATLGGKQAWAHGKTLASAIRDAKKKIIAELRAIRDKRNELIAIAKEKTKGRIRNWRLSGADFRKITNACLQGCKIAYPDFSDDKVYNISDFPPENHFIEKLYNFIFLSEGYNAR